MPAVAVIRGKRVLSVMTGLKGYVGGYFIYKKNIIMNNKNNDGVNGTLYVRVKSIDINEDHRKRKRLTNNYFAEVLRRREQTGLETLVVYAVNDEF